MRSEAIFIPNKRKYLFLADKNGRTYLNPVLELVLGIHGVHEIIDFDPFKSKIKDLEHQLSQQKMGTYLYISLPWNQLTSVKKLVEKIGFSDEEYQSIGYGKKQINLFCCRCHQNTIVSLKDVFATCHNCHLELEISDHYSPLRDAYLGYVAKL